MKKLYLILFFLTWAVWANQLFGCDNSDFVLDSVVFDGTNYTIHTTLCIGGGIIGATLGADNWTGSLSIGLYGDPMMNLISFSPPILTSDTTGCSMQGMPVPGGIGANFNVFYPSPGCFYTCVNTINSCGRPHVDCKQIILTVDIFPDSIKVFGVEGTGIPTGGCFSESDQVINFVPVTPVTWSFFQAQPENQTVTLQWGTAQEINNDYFRILRADRSEIWEEIGQVEGAGNSDQENAYRFTDTRPLPGFNQYKIVQVDLDGRQSESRKVGIQIQAEAPLALQKIYPNPSKGSFDLEFYSSETTMLLIEVFDPKGRQVYRQRIQAFFSKSHFQLVLSDLNPGVYFLRVTGRESQLTQRLLLI